MNSRILNGLLMIAILLSVFPKAFSQSTQSNCYTDVPNVLDCELETLAKTILDLNPRTPTNIAVEVGAKINLLMFFAAADAFTDIKQLGANCSFQAYQHLGETARTDKQIGSSAKSGGSTTLVEKPGFAQLLGFAVERGAIKQDIDETTLTLSTSPYALIASANKKDTAQLYQDYSFFNRFGMSASFNVSDQTNPLANASRKQLTEWSVRVRLTGDRSTRGKAFRAFWAKEIRSKVGAPVALESAATPLVVNADYFTKRTMPLNIDFQSVGTPNSLADQINDYLTKGLNDPDDTKILRIKQIILCSLKALVYDPVKKDTDSHSADPTRYTVLKEDTRVKIRSAIVPALAATPAAVEAAKQLLEAEYKILENKPESTFAYTNHREAMGSDYSELKFLYRMNADKLKLDFNANMSLYNKPNKALNQEKIRDFTIALSFEGGAKNPLNRGMDLEKITYSFAGSYERLKENENMAMRKPDIASVQFKLEFPIALGLSIPIAYTFSNNTEMMMKKENKFNVGLHLDIDKLLEIARSSK